jgi:hypothetical protein
LPTERQVFAPLGKKHSGRQAIGWARHPEGYRVLNGETHVLLKELAAATLDGARKLYMESISTVLLMIIDDFGRQPSG